MTTPQPAALPENACPKCGAISGNDWSQCNGSCPMYGSPHFKPKAKAHRDGLPELPEGTQGTFYEPGFTADQMRAYALAALQSQPAAPGVTGAVQTLIETLKADPEYAWAWHCNVAMAAFDEGLSHYAANKAAARFLSWLAQIDTTTHPGFPKAPEQPAAAGVSDEVIWRLWDSQERTGLVGGPCPVKFARAILALRPQAVPMTHEQMRATLTEAGYDDANVQARADFINGVRYGEAHHGITAQGAQGGEAK